MRVKCVSCGIVELWNCGMVDVYTIYLSIGVILAVGSGAPVPVYIFDFFLVF